MSKKVKGINIKVRTVTFQWCYFTHNYYSNDIINTKSFDANNIKVDEKSYKNIFICYFEYVTIKDSKYVKIDSVSVNLLYLIFNKVMDTLKKLIEKNI